MHPCKCGKRYPGFIEKVDYVCIQHGSVLCAWYRKWAPFDLAGGQLSGGSVSDLMAKNIKGIRP